MNKTYLSGVIAKDPRPLNNDGAPNHVIFDLVVKHVTGNETRKELYRINSWNDCAAYVLANAKSGMLIAVQGYLTQRAISVGDRVFKSVEVTASEIVVPRNLGDRV